MPSLPGEGGTGPAGAGFWHEALGPPPARAALQSDIDVDVCVVGAGYTGLWTAWALLGADPGLQVAVVEAHHVGFGASGRNGGWLSGLMPGDRELLARHPSGRPSVVALQRHLIDAVYSVTKACAEEGIDADIHLGGTLDVATTAAQLQRMRGALATDREWGLGPDDLIELGPDDTSGRLAVAGATGSLWSPHCARIQPAKLVRGLAGAIERRGGRIFEHSPAISLDGPAGDRPGLVRTPGGRVRARWIVRATEGYTASLPGLHRRLLPMNSSIIVTEPLSPAAWAQVGWSGAETVKDGAHAYVYLQRTADGRIAIGGRGVPYRFGSRLDRAGETAPSTREALQAALRRLLPQLWPSGPASGPPIARAWSGVLGVARDWCPAVGVERTGAGGTVWAGGYVGDGVATSHLAGLTMADLVLGHDTSRTALPWVGHRARSWEPEPLRWLGVRAIYALYRAADRAELGHPDRERSSALGRLADVISGKP